MEKRDLQNSTAHSNGAGDSLSNDGNLLKENHITSDDAYDSIQNDHSDQQSSDSHSSISVNHDDLNSEEFNSDEWMDLLDNKEILKKILFTRETDPHNATFPRANRGSRVFINLETKIYSTQQVIASESFENHEVIVGDYDVIHGVDLVLPMMHLYERSRVLINPRFAYGSKGHLPNIPPDCRLDCTVEVLKIDDNLDDCSIEDKIILGGRKKTRGNFWFAREEFQTAISCYRKCVELFENVEDNELNELAYRLLVDTYNNLAIAQFKTPDSLNQALESVNKALFYDRKNVKALYRKALILEKKCDFEEAVETLKIAIELEPSNTSVAILLTSLRKRRLIELENEKKLYRKMISSKPQENNYNCKSSSVEQSSAKASNANKQGLSKTKKLNYYLIAISAIVTCILAFLINNYLINYSH